MPGSHSEAFRWKSGRFNRCWKYHFRRTLPDHHTKVKPASSGPEPIQTDGGKGVVGPCERKISRISRLILAASWAAVSIISSHFRSLSPSWDWASKYEACMTFSIALLKSCARMRSRTTVSLAILGEPSSIGDALLPRPQRCSHSATRGAFRRAAPLHPWPTRLFLLHYI